MNKKQDVTQLLRDYIAFHVAFGGAFPIDDAANMTDLFSAAKREKISSVNDATRELVTPVALQPLKEASSVTRSIPLGGSRGRGRFTLVDDDVYDWAHALNWHVSGAIHHPYAQRNIRTEHGRSMQKLHRVILGAVKGEAVDHANRNTLDNRRQNLRLATYRQNACNRPADSGSASGLKGVKPKASGRWSAYITENGRTAYLGTYRSKEEAGLAYDRAARVRFAEYAFLNYPEVYDYTHVQPVDFAPLSGYRGVKHVSEATWHARICVGGTGVHLGSYNDPVDAAIARDLAAKEAFGDKAVLNFPGGDPA